MQRRTGGERFGKLASRSPVPADAYRSLTNSFGTNLDRSEMQQLDATRTNLAATKGTTSRILVSCGMAMCILLFETSHWIWDAQSRDYLPTPDPVCYDQKMDANGTLSTGLDQLKAKTPHGKSPDQSIDQKFTRDR